MPAQPCMVAYPEVFKHLFKLMQAKVARAVVPREQRDTLSLQHTAFIVSPDTALSAAIDTVRKDGKTTANAVPEALSRLRDQDAAAMRDAFASPVHDHVHTEHAGAMCVAAYLVDSADAMLSGDARSAPDGAPAGDASAPNEERAASAGAEPAQQDVQQQAADTDSVPLHPVQRGGTDAARVPEWHRIVTAAALRWLEAQTRGAPEDTLQDVAQVRPC